jgi:DNA-binding MarR family transcriptional regulator
VYALGQAVRRFLAEAMADGPLSPEDYAIYSAVFEDERITPTRMAARLGTPLTTVMDHIARLERRGHVSRMPDPADRRATQIVLTGEGLAAHRGANQRFERAYRDFLATLSVSEVDAQRSLQVVREAVEMTRARATPVG